MPPPLLLILVTAAVCVCLAAAGRLLFQISSSRARRRATAAAAAAATAAARHPHPSPPPPPPRPYTALCVLGSGGHTAEMLTLMGALLRGHSPPACVVYLATDTDSHSLRKAAALHAELAGSTSGGLLPGRAPVVVLESVPRAREVHQAWASSAVAAARCAAAAVPAVLRARPDVVLTNGPGSAVVVAAVALALRALGLTDARVIYVESVARTRTLSLSGKLLYSVCDRMVVQWPALQAAWPLSEYHGRLT